MENNIQSAGAMNGAGKKSHGWRLLVFILAVLILAAAAIYLYNYFNQRAQLNQQTAEQQAPLSFNDLNQGFVNGDKKLKSDLVMPDNIKQQVEPVIQTSLQAINQNQPSNENDSSLRNDYYVVASDYSFLGNYGQAEEYYLKLLEQWPNDYQSLINLGDNYIMMGQYLSAAQKFYQAIEAKPDDDAAYGKLADLYYKYSSNKDQAKIIYQWGMERAQPTKNFLKSYAAYLENYQKDYAGALAVWREYEKLAGSLEQQEIDKIQQLIELQ